MLARLALALLLVGGFAAPAPADPGASTHAAARKPKKDKKKKKSSRSRRSRAKQSSADEPITLASLNVTTEPAVARTPATLNVGEFAAYPDPPRPRAPVGGIVVSDEPAAIGRGGPGWFVSVRIGPSLVDRRGLLEFRSTNQSNPVVRNVRGELAFGHSLGRHAALGLAAGAGPLPKFFASDPVFDENTRFAVRLYHARLDLELHGGVFVFAVGGGAAYEYTRGTLGELDPATGQAMMHTETFKRFGGVAAVRSGVQLRAAPFTFEILAEATAVNLFRGTYEQDGTSSPATTDGEMAYVGSLLLGVRLE